MSSRSLLLLQSVKKWLKWNWIWWVFQPIHATWNSSLHKCFCAIRPTTVSCGNWGIWQIFLLLVLQFFFYSLNIGNCCEAQCVEFSLLLAVLHQHLFVYLLLLQCHQVLWLSTSRILNNSSTDCKLILKLKLGISEASS